MSTSSFYIDRSSSIPLYEQLRSSIADAISRGDLKPGTQLPTEDIMIDECHVSRQVVRQAYNELVQSGVVVRERGRGTFVKARNYGVFLNKLLSYQEEITRSGKIPKTVVLQACQISTPDKISSIDGFTDEKCFFLERLRSADDKEPIYIQTYLPYSYFPQIEKYNFEKFSLYRTISSKYGIALSRSKRTLSAENATQKISNLLKVPKNKALLLLESHTFDKTNRLVEVSFEYFSSDYCKYEFEVPAER